MRAGVHLDFGRQVGHCKGLFQDCLLIWRSLVVVCRNRDKELRLCLRCLKVRAVRCIGIGGASPYQGLRIPIGLSQNDPDRT